MSRLFAAPRGQPSSYSHFARQASNASLIIGSPAALTSVVNIVSTPSIPTDTR